MRYCRCGYRHRRGQWKESRPMPTEVLNIGIRILAALIEGA